jgi:hypothetical protein
MPQTWMNTSDEELTQLLIKYVLKWDILIQNGPGANLDLLDVYPYCYHMNKAPDVWVVVRDKYSVCVPFQPLKDLNDCLEIIQRFDEVELTTYPSTIPTTYPSSTPIQFEYGVALMDQNGRQSGTTMNENLPKALVLAALRHVDVIYGDTIIIPDDNEEN